MVKRKIENRLTVVFVRKRSAEGEKVRREMVHLSEYVIVGEALQ